MGKNEAAVALGKRRWKGKTKAQKRAHMKMMADKAAEVRKYWASLRKFSPEEMEARRAEERALLEEDLRRQTTS